MTVHDSTGATAQAAAAAASKKPPVSLALGYQFEAIRAGRVTGEHVHPYRASPGVEWFPKPRNYSRKPTLKSLVTAQDYGLATGGIRWKPSDELDRFAAERGFCYREAAMERLGKGARRRAEDARKRRGFYGGRRYERGEDRPCPCSACSFARDHGIEVEAA